MPKPRTLVGVALVGALVTAVPLAFAGSHHGLPSPEVVHAHVEARLGEVLDAVDATPSQREHIEGIVTQGFREGAGLRRDLAALHGRFRAALHDGDADGVEAARKDLVQLVDRKSRLVTGALLEVRATLSDEQWATVEAEHDELIDQVGHHGWR